MVNAIRAEIPPGVPFIPAKAAAISTGVERQHLTLSNGEEVSARLVVLANGLNIALRHSLGIEREVISPCHSISLGFDLKPVERGSFPFRALTYYTESVRTRIAYLTLFPIGAVMRAGARTSTEHREILCSTWKRASTKLPSMTRRSKMIASV